MVKGLLIINYILLLFLFGFAAGIAGENQEYINHTDKEHGFCLNIPQGWQPAALRSNEVIFKITAFADNKPINALNLQRLPVTFDSGENPKVAIDLVASQLFQSFQLIPGSRMISDVNKTVNGKEVREIMMGYRLDEREIHQDQAIFYHQNNVYVLALTAEKEIFSKDIFATAVESFEFIE